MDASLRFLIALMSIGLSSATYIMDDSNTTIRYYPPGDWFAFNDSYAYNNTLTWGDCVTENNCTMTIPFTGSGITLYTDQGFACNFSVSIDGSTPISISFPNTGEYQEPNFTAYNKQSLQSGSHILDLMLLNDTDTPGFLRLSNVLFDYAIVNETNAFPTPATTSNTVLPSTHTSASGHSGHSSVIAAAVGGTLGGISVIVAGISIFVCILKASRSQLRPGEFDSEHKIDTSNDYRVEKPATSVTTWQPAQAAASFEQPDLTITSMPRDIAQYSTTATSSALASLASTSTEEDAALLLHLCNLGLSPGDLTHLISIMNGRKESTVEDIKILQRLDMLNVPADDINLVIAAMQRQGQNREAIYRSSHDGANMAQFPVPPSLPQL